MIAQLGRLIAAAVLVAGLLGGCGSSHDAAETCASVLKGVAPVTDKGSQRATGSLLQIDGGRAGFTPTCIIDVPRGLIAVTVGNTGRAIHNFEIASQHIDVDVARGRAVTVRVRIGSEPIVFVCRYHRSLGMVGVLIPSR